MGIKHKWRCVAITIGRLVYWLLVLDLRLWGLGTCEHVVLSRKTSAGARVGDEASHR